MTKKIGLWMYSNQGGDIIQNKLKTNLQKSGYEVFNDFDLRKCHSFNDKIITEQGFDLTSLDLLFHMNADERSDHQNSILQALDRKIKVVNPYSKNEDARDKFLSNFILHNAKIKTPPSILIPIDISESFIFDIFNKWKSILLKPRRWYGGKGIMKFDSAEQFLDFRYLGQSFFNEFFLQKFIPFQDRDYRVEIIGNKFIGHYSRIKGHSFKTNVKAGGSVVLNKYDEKKINLAQRAAAALNLDITIVDMIDSKEDNEPYVIEVNDSLGVFESVDTLPTIDKKTHDEFIDYDTKKMQALTQYLHEKVREK
jgi:ribosomal protein S6--L-glutamate ligase